MKRLILLLLFTGTLASAQAQLFHRDSLQGAALGGLIGGIIGHNNGGRTAEGIGIGAGAGFLLGNLAHHSRSDYGYSHHSHPHYRRHGYFEYHQPHIRYSYNPYYIGGYAYSPYPHYPRRPNYALTGAALGGLAGGIIGHNTGGQTAEGIAIGTGAGLLLGGVAEHQARREQFDRDTFHTIPDAPTVPEAPLAPLAPAVQTRQVAPNNAMSSANALFGR